MTECWRSLFWLMVLISNLGIFKHRKTAMFRGTSSKRRYLMFTDLIDRPAIFHFFIICPPMELEEEAPRQRTHVRANIFDKDFMPHITQLQLVIASHWSADSKDLVRYVSQSVRFIDSFTDYAKAWLFGFEDSFIRYRKRVTSLQGDIRNRKLL